MKNDHARVRKRLSGAAMVWWLGGLAVAVFAGALLVMFSKRDVTVSGVVRQQDATPSVSVEPPSIPSERHQVSAPSAETTSAKSGTVAAAHSPGLPRGPDGHEHFRKADEYLADLSFNPSGKKLSRESLRELDSVIRLLKGQQNALHNKRIDVCNEHVRDRIQRGDYVIVKPGEGLAAEGSEDVRIFADMDGQSYILDFSRSAYPSLQEVYSEEDELLIAGQDQILNFITTHY